MGYRYKVGTMVQINPDTEFLLETPWCSQFMLAFAGACTTISSCINSGYTLAGTDYYVWHEDALTPVQDGDMVQVINLINRTSKAINSFNGMPNTEDASVLGLLYSALEDFKKKQSGKEEIS